MIYARTHDGERFVIYHGQAPGPYVKFVLTANESYALADALRKYHEERAQRSAPAGDDMDNVIAAARGIT